jgi:hypothetical protein
MKYLKNFAVVVAGRLIISQNKRAHRNLLKLTMYNKVIKVKLSIQIKILGDASNAN